MNIKAYLPILFIQAFYTDVTIILLSKKLDTEKHAY
jgi:hypothetical protein